MSEREGPVDQEIRRLDPALFRPSSTDQKRAKKREAQRKYRSGIRLRSRATDQTQGHGKKESSRGDGLDNGARNRTKARAVDQARGGAESIVMSAIVQGGGSAEGSAESSTGRSPAASSTQGNFDNDNIRVSPRNNTTDSGDEWCLIGHMLPSPSQISAPQPQCPTQPSQQSPPQGHDRQRLPHQEQSASTSPYHAAMQLPDQFDDIFHSSSVFAASDSSLTAALEPHRDFSPTLSVTANSWSGCHQCIVLVADQPCHLHSHWPARLNHHGHKNKQLSVTNAVYKHPDAKDDYRFPLATELPSGAERFSGPGVNTGGARMAPEPATGPPGTGLTDKATTRLQGCSPIFQAVILGNLRILMILSSKRNSHNVVDEQGQTLLHVAAHEGHVDIVDFLLRCGANLDARDSHGNTPLHCAVVSGQEKIVQALVDAGANIYLVNSRPQR
ncbi:palmitoyltransferase akr1 [Fusarium albosuccineum]|uniref:Palmitoyltransferase akr1 n=1 Tax=Fusarium albosuccineum TaxID=1237068 RepID=A0A8H4LCV0_9HYPO|nr:palmitoyltransferase akr1 [Fusarium albosuccineum]